MTPTRVTIRINEEANELFNDPNVASTPIELLLIASAILMTESQNLFTPNIIYPCNGSN